MLAKDKVFHAKVMKEKDIILTARVLSVIFTPFYLPIVGFAALFIFSYMSMLPLGYKLTVMGIVYLFTILFPTILIHIYRRYRGWSLIELGARERRMVPYAISIICYLACYYIMIVLHIPHFMARIVVAALVIQVLCAVINVWWKISTHSSAIGGVMGALMAYSLIFLFDPTWWLCLVLVIAGMVCTSRMILRQHTLWQVVAGFLVGMACGFVLVA